ncbi:hypothetical protein AMJ71_04710 [candidate division TA06 bacterium SM1_40]|uniref:Glycosyltransferase RgtA/B/C/D-like domain-containing protein n=2 Tax=Bacteria division TA06 TaxID=1156500 RepID=A0A0S8JN29_UNCT6|nr:MAG: hypothetical protein AMJ82_01000 [candidate division TA06 bacterium SM23_40]KPL10030.1 MAG: hypothetical protein AMJ71_04710 [candidate division TA06 bacterium SM1_40]
MGRRRKRAAEESKTKGNSRSRKKQRPAVGAAPQRRATDAGGKVQGDTASETAAARVAPEEGHRDEREERAVSLDERAESGYESRLWLTSAARKAPLITLVVILLLAGLFGALLFDPKPSVGGDNAHYLLLAKALATGRGYRSIESPGDPPHTHFPFGYPMLLTPLVRLIPGSILPPKMLSLVLFVGSLLLLYPLLTPRIGYGLTLSVLALLAISPIMLEFSHWALSEIPFLFFTILSMILFSAAERGGRRSWWWFALGSLCLVWTFYIRTVGIALVIAVLVRLAWRRSFKRAALLLIIVVLLAAPWMIRNAILPSDVGDPATASYISQAMMVSAFDPEAGTLTAREYLVRVFRIVSAYCNRVLPKVILPPLWASESLFELPQIAKAFVWPLILGLTLLGLFLQLRRRPALFDIYVIAYLLVLWGWANKNIAAGPRYLLPVLPFLFVYFLEGCDRVLKWSVPQRSTLLPLVLVCVLLVTGTWVLLPPVSSNLADLSAYIAGDPFAGYSDSWANFFSVALFAYDKIPRDAIIMTRKPALFYLYSHRKSVIYPYTRDEEKLYEALAENNVDFVLVDAFRWTKTTQRYLIPAILARVDRFRVICVTIPPKTYLLQVLGDPREWSGGEE